VVSTAWNDSQNLPSKIASPGKIVAYTYSSRGVTGQSETATTDTTGAAKFNAVRDMTQPIIATGWGYNNKSLPISVVETTTPAGSTVSGVTGSWTVRFNTAGDVVEQIWEDPMSSSSSPQSTRFTVIRNDGVPTEIVSPSGVTSRLTYKPRGYVGSVQFVDANSTLIGKFGYEYSLTGSPTALVLPNEARLTVGYDNLNRVKTLSDSDGASVTLAYSPTGIPSRVASSGNLPMLQLRMMQAIEPVGWGLTRDPAVSQAKSGLRGKPAAVGGPTTQQTRRLPPITYPTPTQPSFRPDFPPSYPQSQNLTWPKILPDSWVDAMIRFWESDGSGSGDGESSSDRLRICLANALASFINAQKGCDQMWGPNGLAPNPDLQAICVMNATRRWQAARQNCLKPCL
jgi:hypothetical protein